MVHRRRNKNKCSSSCFDEMSHAKCACCVQWNQPYAPHMTRCTCSSSANRIVHAALWPSMLSAWKLLHGVEAEMSVLPLAESEDRDRWALWLQRPPGYIRPHCLCPLTKRCPLKHWAVRWEVTLMAPLHLLCPVPFYSISVHHTLFLFLPLSFSDTLAYWSDWRRNS